MARYDPDAQRRTETAVRGRDFSIGACDDDTETVSVSGQLLAPAAAVMKQRVAAMVNGLCADDPRSAGERRSDAVGAIADKNDVLACRCGSPDCPTAGVTPKSHVVIRMIADQTAITNATAKKSPPLQKSPPPLTNPPPKAPAAPGVAGAAAGTRRAAQRAVGRGDPQRGDHQGDPHPGRGTRAAVSAQRRVGRVRPDARSVLPLPRLRRPRRSLRPRPRPPLALGPTHASNLNCKCRHHHLMKTFWIGVGGWSDQQLPDATVIWTRPAGRPSPPTPAAGCCSPPGTSPPPNYPPPETKPPPDGHHRGLMMPAPKTHPRRRHRRSHPSRTRTQRTRHPTLLRFSGPLCTRNCAACIELCRQGRRATCCRG